MATLRQRHDDEDASVRTHDSAALAVIGLFLLGLFLNPHPLTRLADRVLPGMGEGAATSATILLAIVWFALLVKLIVETERDHRTV